MENQNILNLPGFGTVRVINEGNNVLFNGNDIATCLGYSKPNNAISTHCHATLKRGSMKSNGKMQDMNYIPESDVYALITSSRLPNAEEFRRILFEEILPSIRATGQYTMEDPNMVPFFNGINTAINESTTQGDFKTQFENSMNYYGKITNLSPTHAKNKFKISFRNIYRIYIDPNMSIIDFIESKGFQSQAIDTINLMIDEVIPVNVNNNEIMIEKDKEIMQLQQNMGQLYEKYTTIRNQIEGMLQDYPEMYIDTDGKIKKFVPLPFKIKDIF